MCDKLIFVTCVLVAIEICNGQEKMGGRGKWKMINIDKCAEDSRFPIKVHVEREKCGRTTECYNADFKMDRDLDDSIGVRCDVCKFVDGGACQMYQTVADNRIAEFLNKYAGSNVQKALTLAGIDPPEFPIKAGDMLIERYQLDFCELPEKAAYGEFKAKCVLLQDSQEVACIEVGINFEEMADDVECEDAE